MEVEVVMLKYESPHHFLKFSVRRIKEAHTHTLARLTIAGRAGLRAQARVHDTYMNNGSPKSATSFES
jgi:hypothetical protein